MKQYIQYLFEINDQYGSVDNTPTRNIENYQ